MPVSLSEMLREPVDSVIDRERRALEDLLRTRNNRAVLFGAGTLGRRALHLLKRLGAEVLALSDNNSSAWGTSVDGVPVLPPAEAASLYGANAVFFVTIWNDRHWFSETKAQLTHLGCDCVSTYAPIHWRFPETFLTLRLLNEPPHRLYRDAESVLQAQSLWADRESLHIYQANIAWRAMGDASELPGRPTVFTYFPEDLFCVAADDTYLDCGAFDGDTVREVLALQPQGLACIYAVEADAVSFAKLETFIDGLPAEIRARIRPLRFAVGKERSVLRFESSGSLTSKASEEGAPIDCFAIDEAFEDKPLSIVKMDIEGAEYDALRGSARVMQRDRPILAICVYHTQSDIWRIPLLVREMLPAHNLYLRAYEGDGFQTVLYAVPPERVVGKTAA